MTYAVEAWTFRTDEGPSPAPDECVAEEEFTDQQRAKDWAWDRLEEGFAVRLWRR